MSILWAVLFIALLFICWLTNFFSLPGNWLMVAVAVAYLFWQPFDDPLLLHEWVVVGLLVLAIAGELLELVAGALGASKVGGSKRGAVLALVGSMVGAVFGLVTGIVIPIPIIGPLLTALVFAGLGAMLGAVLGEQWKGRDLENAWRVGKAAFWGRVIGTLAKTSVGAIMIAVAAIGVLYPWLRSWWTG